MKTGPKLAAALVLACTACAAPEQVRLRTTSSHPDGRSVDSWGGVFASDDFGRSWRSIAGNLDVDLACLDYPLEVQRYCRT